MKRFSTLLALAALLAVVLPVSVLAQTTVSYSLGVVGDNGEVPSSARCRVLTAGSNTEVSIFSDPSLVTAATNPITMSSAGECKWYGAADSYDVLVLGDGGHYKGARARYGAVSRTGNKQVVLQRSVAERILAIPFTRSVSSAQTTTSVTIPAGALIKDVIVETKAAVAASTINVAIGANAGQLQNLCAVATTATALGFANCATTSNMVQASTAISYNTQDHDTTGYIWVKYIETATGP